MKKILFITGSYYPYHSAVSNCVENVVSEFEKDYEVIVLCLNNGKSESQEIYNNHFIIRANIRELNHFKRLHKVLNVFKRIFSKDSLDKNIIDSYLDELYTNKKLSNVDLIISAAMPYESIMAAIEYKNNINKDCKVVPYLFDQFAENDVFHRFPIIKILKYPFHLYVEKKIVENSLFMLMMHSLKPHFYTHFKKFKEKFIFIEHPLLVFESEKEIENNNNYFDSSGINVSYIGGLYKGYVEANYALSVFENLLMSKNDFHLNFFVIGNAVDIVSEYQKKLPKHFINHGKKSKEEVKEVRKYSDFLLSISEKKGKQLSSKIFEYIAVGKPIIHFYTSDNDVNLKVLKKYPVSLLIKEDSNLIEENAFKISNFFEENINQQLSKEDIETLYMDAKPNYTSRTILEQLGN